MRRIMSVTLAIVWAGIASAQVPVVGVQQGSLADLVDSPTLVTIVLKERGAEDPNQRVVHVASDHLVVEQAETGHKSAYLFADLKEIRVQGDRIEARPLGKRETSRELTAQQQQLLGLALKRTEEVFKASTQNQALRMDAAMILAAKGDQAAKDYLLEFTKQDDIATALGAFARLFVAGHDSLDADLLDRAMTSGNRRIRAQAAKLAGLYRDAAAETYLVRMAHDRSADIAAPAARALGRMGNREAIPTLIGMLTELNEEKAEAAMFALRKLGGDDIIADVTRQMESAQGLARYRTIKLLHKLGVPEGTRLLKEESMEVPTLRFDAALVLSKESDMQAMAVLRERLKGRFDPEIQAITLRAQAAASLITGGDPTMISELQGLLRLDFPDMREPAKGNMIRQVADVVARTIAEVGSRSLMPVLQPVLTGQYPENAVAASRAIVAMTDDGFRERIVEYWDMD